MTNPAGETVTLQRLYVFAVCIGYGICENHCRKQGGVAIQVLRL